VVVGGRAVGGGKGNESGAKEGVTENQSQINQQRCLLFILRYVPKIKGTVLRINKWRGRGTGRKKVMTE